MLLFQGEKMKKYKILGVCILNVFLLLFFIFQVQAQISQNRSSITGYIFDQQRKSLSQVVVELMNDTNSVIQRTRTDGSGRYFFSGLAGGRFSIRVLPLGTNLEEQTQEIELVTFGGLGRTTPDNAQKDFYLRVRKDSADNLGVVGAIFVQEVPKESKKLYEKAISSINDKKLEEGTMELENAIKLFPSYYAALESLGNIYLSRQKYEDAKAIFSKAVLVNERSFSSWYGLSFANYALNNSGPAVEAARKAVSLNAISVNAQLFLGISLRQDKQYESAEKTLKKANKLADGKMPDIHWNLALLYAHNLKRYKDAADELEMFLKLSPDNPDKINIKKLIKQFRENNSSND